MDNFEKQLLEATRTVEDQVDAAIQKLDKLEDDDLAGLQRQRAAALKKQMKQKEEWIVNGHGEYSTLTSEKEFFEASKKSKNVVMHCYRTSTMSCAIVDKHLSALATKHIETKFCKLDVEKAPFLCDRLKIRVIPTIILCKDLHIIDFIVGFDELGGVDDFSTEMMEWRLGKSGVINYDEQMKQKEEWIVNGHGEYSTLTSEKEFFEASKKSKNVVMHCYCTSTMSCAIVDKHLSALATKHIETKFCKLDVEKAPFLCNRLKIRVIPTIILCKDLHIIDFIVGFDELGGVDDFSTEMMEWRLGKSGVINYDEDLLSPPDIAASGSKKGSFIKRVQINIRCGNDDSDSEE